MTSASKLIPFSLLLLLSHLSLLHVSALRLIADPRKCRFPVSDCSGAVNLFPSSKRIVIRYATATIQSLKYTRTYVQFTVYRRQGVQPTQRYRMYPCGCSPDLTAIGDTQVLFISPDSFFFDAQFALSAFIFIDPSRISDVKVVRARSDIWDPRLRARITSRAIATLKNGFNMTTVKRLRPALAILENTISVQSFRGADRVKNVPFLMVAESIEYHPLARAEWMKIIALMMGKAEVGNRKFAQIESQYFQTKRLAATAERVPSVFLNYPTLEEESTGVLGRSSEYSWYFPGSRESYEVLMMLAAGASYQFANSASKFLSLPETRSRFGATQFLLNSQGEKDRPPRNLEDYIRAFGKNPDPNARSLIKQFRAMQCANVWAHRRVQIDGADDWYGSAIYRPDEVLKDYVQIMHPDLNFGSRTPRYLYRLRLPSDSSVSLTCPFSTLSGAPVGKLDVDRRFIIPDLNRFKVEKEFDDVVDRLGRAGFSSHNVDLYFASGDDGRSETILTVRIRIDKSKKSSFLASESVLKALRNVYGRRVREVGGANVE